MKFKKLFTSMLLCSVAATAQAAWTTVFTDNFDNGNNWTLNATAYIEDYNADGKNYGTTMRGASGTGVGETIKVFGGNAYTIAGGETVKITYNHAKAIAWETDTQTNYNVKVELFYWDGASKVTFSDFVYNNYARNASATYVVEPGHAAIGKELGARVTFDGGWGPAIDDFQIEIGTNLGWSEDFSTDTSWDLTANTVQSNLLIDTTNKLMRGRTPDAENNVETNADYAETKESVLIHTIAGGESVTVSWTNKSTQDYPGNIGNYGVDAELFYWSDATTRVTLTGSRYSSAGALNAQSEPFTIDPATFPNAIGKKLGVKIVFLGAWSPQIQNLSVTVQSAEETPAIGLNMEIDNGKLNWCVDSEHGVKQYIVMKKVNDLWTEYSVVAAVSASSYSVLIDDEKAEWMIQVVDTSGFTQNFAVDSTSTLTLDLKTGWNLVSTPFAETELPESTTVWIWQNNQYVEVTVVEAGQGFWVYSDDDSSLALTGEPSGANELSVNLGWNLIGPVENTLVPSGVTIYSWDDTYQQILDEINILVQGKGYWIYSVNDTLINSQ